MTTSSFAEVPLLYPCQGATRRRFVIDDEAKSFERTTSTLEHKKGDAAQQQDRLSGSSSASFLGDNAVVTTCALFEEPTVLAVSLIQGTASPIMVELDLSQTKIFGAPVKIQCFSQNSTRAVLRMVDTCGIVLSISLDSSLTPESLELLSVPHLVESQQGYFSGAELDASMVTFLSSTILVLGLAPNLLAVNVASESIDIWSQQQTLAEMNSKSIFSKASDLLLGRTDDDDNVVDMPPASAICQAGGEYVFSLHSDASIRRWRVHELHPTEVVPLKVDAISAPSTWSDAAGAVSLTAQLYQSVYALAIHVQTVGVDEDKSPCQLTVVHGSQNEQEEGDLVSSVLHLTVPNTAKSLVGFDLASERCSLTALFKSNENDLDSTVLVTYPPSVVSIVSTEPIMTPHEYTLDGVASSERARMAGLSFPVASGSSLEEDLHSVDTAFLKYLFRPAFPRGTGIVTPTWCVRAAVRKLVPGHYTSGQDVSIELETLRAMHEWRRLDNRSVASPAGRSAATTTAVVATRGGSVYDAYARHDPDGTPDMNMDESDVEDEEDLLDQERAAQVESHEQRWRELLLAVWSEEERLLEPLCVSNLSSSGTSNFALIRAGVTSLLKENDPVNDTTSMWEDLDRAAMALLERIENSEEGLTQMNSIQTQVYEEIAKASLVLSTGTVGACALELTDLGTKELDGSGDYVFNAEDAAATLRGSSEDDTLDWLQSIDSLFSLGLPGASVLPDSAEVLDDDADKSWSNRIADVQTRLAASTLFVQSTDSVRRLTLARYLLLSNLDGEASLTEDSPVRQAAFRAYLQSVSVLWSCAQQVPMPSAGLFGRNRIIELGDQTVQSSPSDSPPTKRTSFGDTTSSILAGEGPTGRSNVTTVLDARFIQISQEHSQALYEAGSVDGPVITMTRICMNSTFAAALSSSLPELGVLPTPSDESVASEYPRIALRLIAPFYVDPPFNGDKDMMLARKEALAECLLIEANAESQKGPTSDSLVNALQLKSCGLLAPLASDMTPPVEHNLLETVFMTLSKQSMDMPEPNLEEIDRSEKALADEFQLLLTGNSGRPGTEITRLCQQPTVIQVFLPLMATEHKSFFRSLKELSRASVKAMAEVLLRISQLMHRLSILERHAGSVGGLSRNESSGKSDFLLGYIEITINEFQSLLPSSVYDSMAEYASLWTLLFNHSVSSRRWKTAHTVCANRPVPERRVGNYKRLVISMANAGAVSELIDLCSMVTYSGGTMDSLGDNGACIDFYEITAETLAQARQGDPYEIGSISTDFLGCLYALHASRGRWGRAAQAIDAKYALAMKAISSSVGLDARTASIVNVTAAANDLVLASLFTSNAVQSINDPSKRFLVSGEVGPYPSLPVTANLESTIDTGGDEGFSVSNKRDRSGLGWTTPRRSDPAQKDEANKETRLSRFMTVTDLNARAARAIALWIFLRDNKGDSTGIPFSSIQSPSAEGDRTCMDRLASLGYYDQAILFAKAVDKQCKERSCGAQPGGRSLLQDAIIHILSYVLPVALNQGNIPLNGEMDIDDGMLRPTLSQLCRAIEGASPGHPSKNCFSFVLGETWYLRAELPTRATASAAMEFTRKLTTQFSNAFSPIALEVASMFLDIDPTGESLPLWLENLLLGVHEESTGDSSGLFAHKATNDSYSGDPSGLVSLYMKQGMYTKACGIVSALLTGKHDGRHAKSRETRAPARLPEKGDIDFVPYNKIDVLWNLIDHVISNPATIASEKRKLEESRKTMETALEKHFDLMKISEQGMQSARALLTQ